MLQFQKPCMFAPRSHRLAVRTLPSHGRSRGSIPLGTTRLSRKPARRVGFRRSDLLPRGSERVGAAASGGKESRMDSSGSNSGSGRRSMRDRPDVAIPLGTTRLSRKPARRVGFRRSDLLPRGSERVGAAASGGKESRMDSSGSNSGSGRRSMRDRPGECRLNNLGSGSP